MFTFATGVIVGVVVGWQIPQPAWVPTAYSWCWEKVKSLIWKKTA